MIKKNIHFKGFGICITSEKGVTTVWVWKIVVGHCVLNVCSLLEWVNRFDIDVCMVLFLVCSISSLYVGHTSKDKSGLPVG